MMSCQTKPPQPLTPKAWITCMTPIQTRTIGEDHRHRQAGDEGHGDGEDAADDEDDAEGEEPAPVLAYGLDGVEPHYSRVGHLPLLTQFVRGEDSPTGCEPTLPVPGAPGGMVYASTSAVTRPTSSHWMTVKAVSIVTKSRIAVTRAFAAQASVVKLHDSAPPSAA